MNYKKRTYKKQLIKKKLIPRCIFTVLGCFVLYRLHIHCFPGFIFSVLGFDTYRCIFTVLYIHCLGWIVLSRLQFHLLGWIFTSFCIFTLLGWIFTSFCIFTLLGWSWTVPGCIFTLLGWIVHSWFGYALGWIVHLGLDMHLKGWIVLVWICTLHVLGCT